MNAETLNADTLNSEMLSLKKNLKRVVEAIQRAATVAGRDPKEVRLVAVSKGQSVEKIQKLYFLGVRDFAENRLPEAFEKMEQLPSDIRWHFVGKLQKNKISKVLGRFALIHSVDSLKLAKEIALASLKIGMCTHVLLQANTSGEATKGGLTPAEWETHYPDMLSYEGIEIHGLMTMAPLAGGEDSVRHCFSELRCLAQRLEEKGGQKRREKLGVLSMGMSQDFVLAIEEGATLVRIGAALFRGEHENK